MSKPVRVSVVGAGAIAQVAHLPTLDRLDEFQLVGICDNDLPKARSLATRFSIPEVSDDIQDLLERTQPDAVVVCTPNHLHAVHVNAALSAGAHVLCERPLGISVASVEAAIAAHKHSGKALVVCTHHRFRSDVQAIRQFLEGGELGEPHAVRCGWYAFKPARQALGWRRREAQSGGGAMLDLGVGLIDLSFWLLGWPDPVDISASSAPAGRQPGEVEDSGCAVIRLASGMSVVVDVSWHYVGEAERFWFEIMGSGGSARVGPLAVFKEMHGSIVDVTPTGASERWNVFHQGFAAQWAHFGALIRGEVESPDLGEQLRVHRVLDAIYRSANEGVTVPFDHG